MNQGWTLIELVLTISLISIASVFIFRVAYDYETFEDHSFRTQVIQSMQTAKLVNLYSNRSVSMDIKDKVLYLSVGDQSDGVIKSWQVSVPAHVAFTSRDFPVAIGRESQSAPIVFTTKTHTVTIEPRTAYATQAMHE